MESKQLELPAQTRTLTGKRVRHLRRQGLVPGHVYGQGESLNVEIEGKALQDVLQHAGLNTLISLRFDDKTRSVMLRSVDRDNLRRSILNVDLQEVALDEPIRAQVPIVLTGEAPATRSGAVLLRLVDHLNLAALPALLPHSVHIDVTHLDRVDQMILVKDLVLPEGVRVLDEPDAAVVKVAEARAEVKPEVEVAATTAEVAAAGTEAPSGETSR